MNLTPAQAAVLLELRKVLMTVEQMYVLSSWITHPPKGYNCHPLQPHLTLPVPVPVPIL